eukprot:1584311-Rhodomonas_salina.1
MEVASRNASTCHVPMSAPQWHGLTRATAQKEEEGKERGGKERRKGGSAGAREQAGERKREASARARERRKRKRGDG